MKKALLIAQKDILQRLRDPGGLAFLLLLPLGLTFIMGQVFGGDDADIPFRVPVAVINHDRGLDIADASVFLPAGVTISPELQSSLALTQFAGLARTDSLTSPLNNGSLNLGQIVVDVLTSAELATILETTVISDSADVEAARAAILAGEQYCCLVTLPATLTTSLLRSDPITLAIYHNPDAAISLQIVQSVVQSILDRFSAGQSGVQVGVEQLIRTGAITDLAALPTLVNQIGEMIAEGDTALFGPPPATATASRGNPSSIQLVTLNPGGDALQLTAIGFFVPALAILFLGYGAAAAGRTILAEEEAGTFGRLNAAPLSAWTVLIGKLLAIFVVNALQFGLLIVVGSLLFGVRWGNPLSVAIFAIVPVLAFTCLGLLMAVIARDSSQANTITNTVLLVFGLIGGNFTPAANFPPWLRSISQLTPNYWGVAGFIKLVTGQGLAALQPEVLVLLIMVFGLFVAGLFFYRRRVVK